MKPASMIWTFPVNLVKSEIMMANITPTKEPPNATIKKETKEREKEECGETIVACRYSLITFYLQLHLLCSI